MNRYICAILIMSILTLSIGTVVGQDVNAGKVVFDTKCGTCHRSGGIGPNMAVLTNYSVSKIRNGVRNGVSGTAMMAYNTSILGDSDLNNVIAYIKSTITSMTPSATPMTNATPMVTISVMTTETPAMTTVEETTIPPEVSTPTKSPGFDVILGVVGILLISRLKHK